jgi:mono/diheme cytochrome c family protein
VCLLLAVTLSGCGDPPAVFVLNDAYFAHIERKSQTTFDPRSREDIGLILASTFGEPDDPYVPLIPDLDATGILDLTRVKQSSGRVWSDKIGIARGLYREHCIHCHGMSGDGLGPTASFLNPYPRDYRMGIFKFKSTGKGLKPTHDDLVKILTEGIPGTAMPSFKVLDTDEIESLVHYVRYLSIRGELERKLIELLPDVEDRLLDDALRGKQDDKYKAQWETIRGTAREVMEKWVQAEGEVQPVPARPDGWQDPETMRASVEHGRKLFYGKVANCFSCHGDSALGDGQLQGVDAWTRELLNDKEQFLGLAKMTPVERDRFEYVKSRDPRVLPPRNIRPRNLRQGVFRGGRRPIDIYLRIVNGIDGTPMPSAPLLKPGETPSPGKLSTEDIWSLVDYVRSLQYESISNPNDHEPVVTRERL